MKINCDIGERGFDHPVDMALMELIDIANIACGGHAGDTQSVRAFRKSAEKFCVEVSAHLSYPDKKDFGRKTILMPLDDLILSLSEQYDMMEDVKMVKFHGALYNDCVKDSALAVPLAAWLKGRGTERVITPPGSELAAACEKEGITLVAEAFAERRYAFNDQTLRLTLVNRDRDYASIQDINEATAQTWGIFKDQVVTAHVDDGTCHVTVKVPLKAETICIHSDSVIALDLARALKDLLN